MSSHNLAIAKASFAAGLLRPDPQGVPRDDIAHFHTLLHEVSVRCSPSNVQKCKRWILSNIIQSAGRCLAFGKYLNALSSSFNSSQNQAGPRETSARRKRLHLLYLLNDLLHHAQSNSNDASVVGKFQPALVELFRSAASFSNCPKHQRKLVDLLDIWLQKGYYSEDYIWKLRETVKAAAEGDSVGDTSEEPFETDVGNGTKSKLTPYVMPAMHGDLSTPWYDLPAGNIMPLIEPNSARPINPASIKPLRLIAGPADDKLVSAVKIFMNDVEKIFGIINEDEHANESSFDVDELGQPIIRDEITGDIVEGEGYYGWSRSFCEKMKRRRNGRGFPADTRGRSLSSSRSPDGSSIGFKRRRYSSSEESTSRSRSRGRRPRSRSQSMDGRSRDNEVGSDSRQRQPRQDDLPENNFGQANAVPSPTNVPYSQARGYTQSYSQGSAQHLAFPPPPPPPPSLFSGQQYGNFVPPPPPSVSNQWPHPFPPPPTMAYDQHNAPPPPPFPPNQNSWQSYGQPPPPPPPPAAGPGGWQRPPEQYNGDGGYGAQGRGNYQQYQGRGRGRGGHRGRGW